MREQRSQIKPEVLVLEAVTEDFKELTSVFQEMGFRVIISSDPDPLRFFAARSIDLVVLNLHYPNVDPFPLLAMAKKKGTPAIVVSRSFHQEEARAACRLGAEVVWDLPLDRDRFIRSLCTLFPVQSISRKKILVIDDVDETRSIFTHTLQSGSFDVLEARTGKEGLSLARKNTDVDLILLDIGLPDIDGLELHARFRQDPLISSIPILFCTVRGRDGDFPSAEEYIQKPISPAKLLEKVSLFFAASPWKY